MFDNDSASLIEELIKGLYRSIAWVFTRLLFEYIFYAIGWPFVKIITLGTYPKGKQEFGWYSESREGTWTSMLGLLITVCSVLAYLEYQGYM